LILAVAGAVHGSAVRRNFSRHHWEDWRFFRHDRALIHSPLDCFTRPSAWPGLYRPLSTNCYYLVGRWLFGNRIEPYHVVNGAFFLMNAVLLLGIARSLGAGTWAVVPPALLASRIAHRQVLLYTSEIQALLSVFFSLAALWLFLAARARPGRSRLDAAALAAFGLGLLSKESAAAVPAIVTAYGWLYDRRGAWTRYALWWAVAAAWAVLFATVFRGVSGHQPTGYAYDLSAAVLTRYVSYFLLFLNSLVYPVDNWEVVTRVPLLAHSLAVRAAVGTAALAAGAVLAAARRLGQGKAASCLRRIALGGAWFVAGTAPFVIFQDRLFMRYSYFGHAGLALAAGAFLELLWCVGRERLIPETAAATSPSTAPATP